MASAATRARISLPSRVSCASSQKYALVFGTAASKSRNLTPRAAAVVRADSLNIRMPFFMASVDGYVFPSPHISGPKKSSRSSSLERSLRVQAALRRDEDGAAIGLNGVDQRIDAPRKLDKLLNAGLSIGRIRLVIRGVIRVAMAARVWLLTDRLAEVASTSASATGDR